ncbi:MAG: MarR family transcriptional regulator [Flavobacteriales bacterium]|nr:MarR family transcriptional regulator [Flavobacteriales bacterium]MBP9080928.1 MarR family transcriptional regulator [Flavobacteriales bacterium]
MKPEETIDHPIRWAWHRIARRYNTEAAKHGGSMSVGYALLNIDPEGTPSTKLGPKMGMEAHSLTRTLRNMEDQGLVQRVPDSTDGRMMRIVLTPAGKRMRDISKEAVIRFNTLVQTNITAKDLNTFQAVMTQINALLDNDEHFK